MGKGRKNGGLYMGETLLLLFPAQGAVPPYGDLVSACWVVPGLLLRHSPWGLLGLGPPGGRHLRWVSPGQHFS